MKPVQSYATVLTTVNAPYSIKLNEAALAACLSDVVMAKTKPGHISSFFGEVPLADQIDFATAHGVSPADLKMTAQAFATYSGETYPLLA